ncbi:hypothetical protein F4804DRAFT_75033 [Jackrogersella minutella]|nr:hypothetical protein F4804DRAFT_75033 [Jackrogersella minutella]
MQSLVGWLHCILRPSQRSPSISCEKCIPRGTISYLDERVPSVDTRFHGFAGIGIDRYTITNLVTGEMGLVKIGLIAASTKEPRAPIQQSFDVATTLFAPTLVLIVQCQHLLGAATVSLLIQAHWLSWQIFCVSRIIVSQVYVASRYFRYHTVVMLRSIWKTGTVRLLRKKVVFEFVTLLLGGGNCLCLVLFWPGWWVLGLVGLAARLCVG